jgi:two-component system CheB/CheR fusion protein
VKKPGKDEAADSELRRRAERELSDFALKAVRRADGDARRLAQELAVHEIELRMQNEELRAARLEIEAGLARYTELFDFAPIGYAALTREGVIGAINHAGVRLVGSGERRGYLGESFGFLVATKDAAVFDTVIVRALETGEPAICEVELARRSQPKTKVRLTATALWRVAADPTVLVAFEDITEQREQREQLARTEQALREADRRKDEFMGALSHELRNPLAPIRTSLATLACVDPGDERATRAREVLERQIAQLVSLIDDLLDVTRIGSGKVQLKRSRVELGDLLRQVLDDQRPAFQAKGVALAGRWSPEAIWVFADPTRLVQIVTNLLGNAEKFTPRGGEVELGLETMGAHARVRVRDTGAGIAPEMLAHVFEPFHQAPQTMDRSQGGLGLGLAMVKGLVEAHGGRVSIASDGPGRGTEIEVLLPLTPAPAAAAEAAPQSRSAARRVLVIDDNVDAAEGLAEVLRIQGHEVAVAFDGPSGIELARRFQPGVVICDIGLPRMDGYAVARAIREERALCGIFLVALSGYARPDDLRRASEAGFDRHVAKPPELDEIDRILAGVRA